MNETDKRKVNRKKSIQILFDVSILKFLHTEAFIEKKGRPKEVARPQGLYTILTRGNQLWRSDKTREREFGFLGVVNYGKVNIGGSDEK